MTEKLNLKERMIHRRAVEAVIWSMPLMNFKAMRDSLMDATDVGYNDVAYYSQLQDWKFQYATPNDTTPYIMSFWNLKDGPVVVEIPPAGDGIAIFGTLMDAWQRPLEDVGARGKDMGLGGKYLILPPRYQGPYPAGYIPIPQNTFNGFTILRPIIADASAENLKKAAAYTKQLKIYPLVQADNPPSTRHIDIYDVLIDGIARFDASFFDNLNQIVQEEHIETKDLAMMGGLASIGIKRGAPYQADAQRKEILQDAAQEAHQYLIEQFHDALLPRFYPDRQWMNLFPASTALTGSTYELPTHIELDDRAATYYAICTSVKNYGTATFYLTGSKDADGQWLAGDSTYKMTVPANVPVTNFWSTVVYDVESAAWLKNQPKVGVGSSDEGLQTNEGGTVDVYFGPQAPAGKEANWVPTTRGRKFFLVFRFYGPEMAVFNKSWKLNDPVKV